MGTWMAGGVIPAMIYYGLKIVNPNFLLLTAFWVSVFISIATGTSWGTVGTIGVALIGVGVGLGVPLPMVAGAVISGAYFGDKMSPLSDTTNMSALAAKANLYDHIKQMFVTTVPAMIIACIAFTVMGLQFKSSTIDSEIYTNMLRDLPANFRFSPFLVLPPVLVIGGAILKKPTVPVLILSSAVAMALGLIIAVVFLDGFFHFPQWAMTAVLAAVGLVVLYAIIWLAVLKIDVRQLIRFAGDVRQERYQTQAHLSRSDEIRDLYEELYKMKEELRILNNMKEELLQSVTHNLKMPVSVIYLTAECMKDGLYMEVDLESSCDKIMEMSNQLSLQIETLMAINRNHYLMQAGDAGDECCNLKPMIEQQLSELEDMFAKKGIHCRAELYNVQFTGSARQWQCVIQNLMENALRHADSSIEIQLHRTSLSVINDGEPVEKDILDTIFQAYVFGTKGKSGLGLALVDSILKLNGYAIQVKNLEKGVMFKITKTLQKE